MVSAEQRDRVAGLRRPGRARPAPRSSTGGAGAPAPRFFYEPTVVAGVGQDDEIVQREVFGPVVTVQRFADEDRGARLGQRGGLRTGRRRCGPRDVGRALRVATALQFGTVWVNDHVPLVSEMPHGGFKQSGDGKDMSVYAIEAYTELKHVMVKIA